MQKDRKIAGMLLGIALLIGVIAGGAVTGQAQNRGYGRIGMVIPIGAAHFNCVRQL
jgi:hypothetical protein